MRFIFTLMVEKQINGELTLWNYKGNKGTTMEVYNDEDTYYLTYYDADTTGDGDNENHRVHKVIEITKSEAEKAVKALNYLSELDSKYSD